VFIDTEHALDLAWAATCGIDPHRLLLCHQDSSEQALQVTSVLVGSGAVDALAIDSIAALVPQVELDAATGEHHSGNQGRLLSGALRKLVGPIARAGIAVVVVVTNQLRQRAGVAGTPIYTSGGRALGYYASVRLRLDQPRDITRRGQAVGRRGRVQVVKNRLAAAWQTYDLELHRDHGIRGALPAATPVAS
jgi:recombination protein RecA